MAISIFTVSLLGLMSVLASGITSTTYAKQKILATYLAQEGIEYIRNARDTDVLYPSNGNAWANTFKSSLSGCVSAANGCGFSSYTIPASFFPCSSSTACKLFMNNNGGYDANSGGIDSGFTRKIWKNNIGADEVRIFSNVSWVQGSGNYSITFSEDLFNWVP